MDEFEKRLKRDADAMQVEVTPALRSRIDASLHGVEPIRPVEARERASTRLWWASSLTGLAAVVALIVIGNLDQPESGADPDSVLVVRTEPPMPVELPLISPELDIRSAEFTSPLEEELLKLQADLEKARETVRKDVDFTF
jgi:hypothetical protein